MSTENHTRSDKTPAKNHKSAQNIEVSASKGIEAGASEGLPPGLTRAGGVGHGKRAQPPA